MTRLVLRELSWGTRRRQTILWPEDYNEEEAYPSWPEDDNEVCLGQPQDGKNGKAYFVLAEDDDQSDRYLGKTKDDGGGDTYFGRLEDEDEGQGRPPLTKKRMVIWLDRGGRRHG